MVDIAIEVSEKSAADELEALGQEVGSFASERRGLDGQMLLTVIMTLAPMVITGIVAVVRARIAAQKHVRVIVDGMEIHGVSERALLEILKAKSPQANADDN